MLRALVTSPDRIILYRLEQHYRQWCLEYNPAPDQPDVHFVDSTALRPDVVSDPDLWHQRLGHPGKQALEQLAKSCSGGQITGIPMTKCEYCAVAKIQNIVSRRERDVFPTYPFQWVSVDFFGLPRSYSGNDTIILFFDPYTMMTIIKPIPQRSREGLRALRQFDAFLDRQYGLKPKAVRTDDDSSFKTEFNLWIEENGYLLEQSAVRTPEQNASAERAGQNLFSRARALESQCGFP